MGFRSALIVGAMIGVVSTPAIARDTRFFSEHKFKYSPPPDRPLHGEDLSLFFATLWFQENLEPIYDDSIDVRGGDYPDLLPPSYESSSSTKVRLPGREKRTDGARAETTILDVDIKLGVIAPELSNVEDQIGVFIPVDFTNPTGAPITTNVTINAAFDSEGTYPASGSVSHGGAAGMFDVPPDTLVFFGPDETWSESFSPIFGSQFLGLIDNIQPSVPGPGRWAATGDGSVSYEITIQPGETLQRWFRFTAYAGISNFGTEGLAQYDALNEPHLFSYDVVLGDDAIEFAIAVPAPGSAVALGALGLLATRRRRD